MGFLYILFLLLISVIFGMGFSKFFSIFSNPMKLENCKELSQHAIITNVQTKLAFDGRNYKTTVSFSDGSEYLSFYSGSRGRTIYVDKDIIEIIIKKL